MEAKISEEVFIPYHTMMENIMTRLEELGKLNPPKRRTHYTLDGPVTEDVPEYYEQEELIRRWYELQRYKRAIDPAYHHNRLIVALNLEFVVSGVADFDPTVAARIAVSVYTNSPWSRYGKRRTR